MEEQYVDQKALPGLEALICLQLTRGGVTSVPKRPVAEASFSPQCFLSVKKFSPISRAVSLPVPLSVFPSSHSYFAPRPEWRWSRIFFAFETLWDARSSERSGLQRKLAEIRFFGTDGGEGSKVALIDKVS